MMTVMRFELEGRRLRVDFARPRSIAIPLDFGGPQPAFFDAPPAVARPLFEGMSVNCEQLTLVPHCNGTHTECVGHVTNERVAVAERVSGEIVFALLLSVAPVPAPATPEDSDPAPASNDRVVTAAALQAAAARHAGPSPRALIVHTAAAADSPHRAYRGASPAPFLTRQAAEWLVERGVEHLVLDLPSADRAADGGRLTAHRIFFGLPAGSRRAGDAARPRASITELAWIGDGVPDGFYLLDLQIPAFLCDAAPSRPLLYPVQFE
jgi:kynurenine formamidase